MADEDNGPVVNPSIPADNELAAPLENARSAFPGEQAGNWADGILTQVQQHLNMAKVADANQEAGNQFVLGLGNTKDNLVDMAKADPSSAQFAIDLAPQLFHGMLQHVPDEQYDDVHGAITSHTQQEIARAAITSMAETHGDAARVLMGQLGQHLAPGDTDYLDHYIGAMEGARQADHGAQVQQLTEQQARASSLAAYQHAGALLDQRTDEVRFPPDYVSSITSNTNISPADKNMLYTGYNNLRAYGDAPASNPHTVAAVLANLGDTKPVDIANQVGSNLKYADAMVLHGLMNVRTPEGRDAARQLSDTVGAARDELTAKGDRAGDAAFGRFTDWLLSAYRRTGPAGLNPGSDTYLFANASPGMFTARHEDIPQPAPVEGRPSLSSIFGGGMAEARPPVEELNDRLRPLNPLHEENMKAPGGDNFFQRKLQEMEDAKRGQG